MGIVQFQLPDDLRSIIDRQVADGLAASEADYVTSALRLYADHLDAEAEMDALVERADADIEAGRFATVITPEDSDALHVAAMGRLRVRLAANVVVR